MALYRLSDPGDLIAPALVAAFDGWVDAGSAATTAAELIAEGGEIVATFDADELFDYRARRPTLDIVDGRLAELSWPELVLRRASRVDRDVLVLAGMEPDYRWHAFADGIAEIVRTLGVAQWVSLGEIPAAVPHTRPVPIIGTASGAGLLRGDVRPGPEGLLRVPSAALSVLELMLGQSGTPAVGYFAQVPHYVSGPYAPAALELVHALERHLNVTVDTSELENEARLLRARLDAATATEESTRAYVERLESMVDEERLPAGDELISEIERFLREGGSGRSERS